MQYRALRSKEQGRPPPRRGLRGRKDSDDSEESDDENDSDGSGDEDEEEDEEEEGLFHIANPRINRDV